METPEVAFMDIIDGEVCFDISMGDIYIALTDVDTLKVSRFNPQYDEPHEDDGRSYITIKTLSNHRISMLLTNEDANELENAYLALKPLRRQYD